MAPADYADSIVIAFSQMVAVVHMDAIAVQTRATSMFNPMMVETVQKVELGVISVSTILSNSQFLDESQGVMCGLTLSLGATSVSSSYFPTTKSTLLVTEAIENVGFTSATCGGNITTGHGLTIQERGIC